MSRPITVIVECMEPVIVDKMCLHRNVFFSSFYKRIYFFSKTVHLNCPRRNKNKQNPLKSTSLSNVLKQPQSRKYRNCESIFFAGSKSHIIILPGKWQVIRLMKVVTILSNVVPRAVHCGIPAILPSMSLKNAPSVGLRTRPRKIRWFFAI